MPRERLVTRDFVVVTFATFCFMVSFGATLPIVPRYVAGPLGGSDLAVGLVVGAHALSAIAVRPLIGSLGDRRGRRMLVIGGALLTACGMAAHIPATSVLLLVGARLLVGIGQGALFVGATTMIQDLSPPQRRGEAASYFSIAIYTGLGLGPFAGETLLRIWSYDVVWTAVSLGMVLGALVGVTLPRSLPADHGAPDGTPGRTGLAKLFHPAGVAPGVVLFLGIVGFTGFNTFVPLYGEEIGMQDVASVFLLYAFVVLFVRLAGGRIPDVLGPVRAGTAALVISGAGLVGIGTWQAPIGLYLFTIVLAAGSSLLYPALMVAAVNGAPEHERSSVIATFSMFFEVATAGGGAVLGLVASQSSYSGAFVAGAGFSIAAVVMLHVYLRPRLAIRSAHV